MKHVAFNMIPKVNNKVCKGNSWHSHDPRKFACWNPNEDDAHHFLRYQGYCSLL